MENYDELELEELDGAMDEPAVQSGEINDLVEKLFELKNQKAALSEEVKDLEKQIGSIEYTLINRMTELGIDKLSTGAGSVTKKTDIYPNVLNFDEFVKFCFENNRMDFLQKRVNSAPFKEFFEMNNEYPPGLDGYTKDTLNSRRKR